ncbi:MAG: diguanylate cyclase [Burkholderiales bacterium]|nr:diguanylate cyclase [Burkholderiales bacterium]
MRKLKRLQLLGGLTPATRLAIGLVSLMISLILLADLFVGILPDRVQEAKRHRTQVAESIATQITGVLRTGDPDRLRTVLAAAVQREAGLLAAAIWTEQDDIAVTIGDYAERWRLGPRDRSSLENIRLPIQLDHRPWGEVRLVFAPALPTSLLGWVIDPVVLGFALLAALGFLVFQLYLRRGLRYLDPSAAVPERVRTAFDTLTEGVLVLDPSGRVMLANKAFHNLWPERVEPLTGVAASSIDWLVGGLGDTGLMLPWTDAMEQSKPLLGYRMRVDVQGRGGRELVLNCSPISDGYGRIRGCLATFADVTELHERTERLRVALDDLRASEEQVRQQNEELTRLATRDPMTGCLNRRSFMADCEKHFAAARRDGTPLSCIMSDIDHFKNFNDRYGHAVGDQVIQSVARALGQGLRANDLLCRYGGEEFCIVLIGFDVERAAEIAERLRASIETRAGSAIRTTQEIRITSSFGVAEVTAQTRDIAQMIDEADQALYLSKRGGRNRVTRWTAETAQAAQPAAPPKLSA